MITADQLRDVLDSLPPPNTVISDYYSVAVMEPARVTPCYLEKPNNKNYRMFEFRKNNGQWVIDSFPSNE